MMFATCAQNGCTGRIPYDPIEDAYRPRYCEKHLYLLCRKHGYDEEDVESPFFGSGCRNPQRNQMCRLHLR